jgi:hypothetical protein
MPPSAVGIYLNDILFACQEEDIACALIYMNHIDR